MHAYITIYAHNTKHTYAQVPGDLMHAIYSTKWSQDADGLYFPLSWDPEAEYVNAMDVTWRYLTEPSTRIQ